MLIGWGICGAIWLTAAAEIRGTVPQMVRTISSVVVVSRGNWFLNTSFRLLILPRQPRIKTDAEKRRSFCTGVDEAVRFAPRPAQPHHPPIHIILRERVGCDAA